MAIRNDFFIKKLKVQSSYPFIYLIGEVDGFLYWTLTGSSSQGGLTLVKTDTNFNIISTLAYKEESIHYGSFSSIIKCSNGDRFLIGYYHLKDIDEEKIIIIRLDKSDTYLWNKTYQYDRIHSSSIPIIKKLNTGYVIWCRDLLFTIDEEGTVLERIKENLSSLIQEVEVYENTIFLIGTGAGGNDNTGRPVLSISKFDNKLNIQENIEYLANHIPTGSYGNGASGFVYNNRIMFSGNVGDRQFTFSVLANERLPDSVQSTSYKESFYASDLFSSNDGFYRLYVDSSTTPGASIIHKFDYNINALWTKKIESLETHPDSLYVFNNFIYLKPWGSGYNNEVWDNKSIIKTDKELILNDCIRITDVSTLPQNSETLNKRVITNSFEEVQVIDGRLPLRVETQTEYSILELCKSEEKLYSLNSSTITANPNTIEADGTTQATITVQLKDAAGNDIGIGGETVVIATNNGILTTTIDNGDGTYTALLSATVGGSAILSFTVNGNMASNTAAVKFKEQDNCKIYHNDFYTDKDIIRNWEFANISWEVDAEEGILKMTSLEGARYAKFFLNISEGVKNLEFNGKLRVYNTDENSEIGSSIIIQIRSYDVDDNYLGYKNTTIQVNNLRYGVPFETIYSETYSLPEGTSKILFRILPGHSYFRTDLFNLTITDLDCNDTDFSLKESTITAFPDTIIANGVSSSVITVTLRDNSGNIITSAENNVVISTTKGTITSTTNQNNGTYTAYLTGNIEGTATLSFTVDGVLSPNTTDVVLEPVTLEVGESTKLQSTNLYMQAAGSTGGDGSVKGIHLRWLLKGYLGKTHLPKGNNAKTNNHFNKTDDFVSVFRAPYTPRYTILDFQNYSPGVVDHHNYLWIYRINEVSFYVYFKNTIQYNTVKGSINALTDSYDFIQSYGDEIIEVDQKSNLSFATTIIGATETTNIRVEALSVENNTWTAIQYVAARKKFIGEGRIEEENIRVLRYKANHVKMIQFELYADTLMYNTTNENWEFLGKYALTTEDSEAKNRLEPADNSAQIHGKWPRFNDGETVNKENYIDRWNGEETQSYGSAYYENYDRRLKTVIRRYIELSDEDVNNPVAMESIPFNIEGELPTGVDSPEDDTQDISNLTMLQLASMDYHVARMLGLGHIDTSIDTNQEKQKYIYVTAYKTVSNIANGLRDENAKEIQHLFLSLPTAIEDERLPIPVNLSEPSYGVNSDNESMSASIDELGYLYDGKRRFIRLKAEALPDSQTNVGFFEELEEFDSSKTTFPVYAGLEYKLFNPANPDMSNWRKPELSNTSKYRNYTLINPSTTEKNETVPLLIPESDETLFLHHEREEGWHRYGSYGINWFSRSQRSAVYWDVETRFKPTNRLLPPSNIKACLIIEESPLMLTSSKEQELLEAITDTDKTLVRLTFDHHINQDGITYQINEESMGTFSDPLHENAIFKDEKEVFADKINVFFRNKTPQTVKGKIKSINPHPNNSLVIIRTEGYELASTGDIIFPEIDIDQLEHFIGSIFMFNDKSYIIHEVTASPVIGEGPIFTVYKELISEAMITGVDPDPTMPLSLPEFTNPDDIGFNASTIVPFNTVENMLTEGNWTVGTSTTINKLDFQITIGDDWPIHREVIAETSISGVPEQILEKSRGIWETATIEEWHRPQENIYDANGALVAEPKHIGMYKITCQNSLGHHPQYDSHNVDWYQGIVRIHTQNNPGKKRKILEVVRIENVGTSAPLVLYAVDPQFPVNVLDNSSVEGFDPILTGTQEVNFYPGYRVYLYHDTAHHLTEEAILPSAGEGVKYSILGLQSADPDYPENAASSEQWYTSKISAPALFFAQEIIRPETPLLSNGDDFIYATRPDTFGKSTFSLTPGFKHIPHGIQFYRSNDDAILNALYKPATVIEIKEKLKEDFDSKLHLVKRWQNLLGFHFEYDETFQTDGEFFLYPEDDSGYRFPKPDKYQVYKAINDILEYRNDNYGTTYPMLDLGDPEEETNNGIIGNIDLSEIVIPKLESEGIEEDVTFKDFIQSIIFNAFTPLTEIPLIYEYIRSSDYQPIAKKQVVRDKSGGLLPPTSLEFDMAPMAKRMSAELTNEIQGAQTRVLFTDFNLDGTSDNLYFYAIREMGSTMQLGDYSPIFGPVKLVNTKPPLNPDIKRILPVLKNEVLGIVPAISVEINAYPKVQNIKQLKLYRTLDPNKALSVRSMDLIKIIDLETDEQPGNNIWNLKDEFTGLDYVPYGDPLYYRVVALREIQYADGSNTVSDNHPQIIEFVPSEPSKLLITSIVENVNPQSPTLKYNFDSNLNDNSSIDHVILKWDKKVHNGKYYVYKMNSQGNWIKIHTLITNRDDIQLLLVDTSIENGTLLIKNQEGGSKYHHFKVISENSVGMMSTEERILTIPNIDNLGEEEGIGDMITENTNIVR